MENLNNSFSSSNPWCFPHSIFAENEEHHPLALQMENLNKSFSSSNPWSFPHSIFAEDEEHQPLALQMENLNNSFSSSNPWSFPHSIFVEDEEHHPLNVPPPSPNPQFPVFNIEYHNSNSMDNIGVVGVNEHLTTQFPMFGDLGCHNSNNNGNGVDVNEHSRATQFSMFENLGNNNSNVIDNVDANKCSKPKSRGRPRGSKNKPKGDVVLENNFITTPTSLVVPAGSDVIDWVGNLAQSVKCSVVIHGGSGSISQVTLSHIETLLPPITYSEHLTLVSFSGSYLFSPTSENPPCFFSAFLMKMDGGLVSGTVWKMVSMSPVKLTVTIFNNPNVVNIGY